MQEWMDHVEGLELDGEVEDNWFKTKRGVE